MVVSKVVSEATLRVQDLIPAFLSALRERDPTIYAQIMISNAIPAYAFDDDEDDWWQSDEAHILLEELFDALNETAEEGEYFGAHEGDGCLFGFWSVEETFDFWTMKET